MNVVAGRPNKPNALGIWPGQDRAGRYTKRCIEFADTYGFPRGEVCTYWSQIALAREFECKQARDIAEDGAWHDVQKALHELKVNGDCN